MSVAKGTGGGGGGGGGAGYGMWRRGGTFSCVYRNELSLDLKQSSVSDSAVTTSWGWLFQSGMVLGKNVESLLVDKGITYSIKAG